MFRSPFRILIALPLTLVLPTLSWLGPDSGSAHKPFVAAAQAGCTPSPNQIIQKACSLPIISQFEQAAVQSYLAIHSLTAADATALYQSGGSQLRNDIRALMLDLLVSYANQDPSTLENVQANAYYWLEGQVQAQEKKYWAAAAAEYNLWFADRCHYKLDKVVAFQQGLDYDPVQWCYPNLGNYFSTPAVPTYEYFLAVAWKKTYGSLIATSSSDSVILANTQQQTADYAALYAFPAALTAGTIGGLTVAKNMETISPFLGRVFEAKVETAAPIARAEEVGYTVTDKFSGEVAQQAPKVINQVEQAATKSLAELNEIAAEVFEFASDLSALDVVAVAVFAIETAVEAGISAVNTQATLDKLATLPATATQVAQNPPSLSTLLSSQDGYTKVSTVFVAATLPEYATPAVSANLVPPAGLFYVRPYNIPLPVVVYKNALGATSRVILQGGWFASLTPGTSNWELVGSINYLDWQGNPRFARRVGPYQFLVYRQDPLVTDHFCPASATDSHLSMGFTPDQCFSYVTDTLQMVDTNGQHISVEVINLPTLTSANYVNFTPTTPKSFQVTFTTSNDVPCSISRSGPLPLGINYDSATFTFSGNTTAQYAGVYNQTLTVTCGTGDGLQKIYPFSLVVSSSPNLTFTSPATISGTAGIPISFKVTTTGAPPGKLTASVSLSYYGLSFQDNGDGTGVISGRPHGPFVLCDNGTLVPCDVTIDADNGVQHISQTLSLQFADYPVQLSFSSPASGTTLTFPINVSTTYVVLTKGAIANQVQIEMYSQGFRPLPPWLHFHDNGDGTATIQGLPTIANLGSTQLFLDAAWCCGSENEIPVNVSVVYPKPFISVAPNNSMAFLAGTAGFGVLTSNIQDLTGYFQPSGPLPTGLQFYPVFSNPLCTGFCPVQANISGTPAPGSGGDYKVPFTVSNSTGTFTQIMDIVVYEKPALTSGSRLIFYAGVPSTAVITTSGFPTKSIGPFDDGVGYSVGATFSDPTSSLPLFLKLTSGLGGAPNGTARLPSTAAASDIGLHPIRLTIQESAAPSPSVTNPTTQLGTTVNMNVYVVPAGDVNLDFRTDCSDLTTLRNGFGKARGTAGYDSALDVNNDGIIDVRDLSWVASKLPPGTRCQ